MQTFFLVGPTAVGKSAVALELARSLKAEILSTDSMQVYRGMDIGTAKPTSEERKAIRHHLIDVCEVDEPFDVKQFVTLAQSLIANLQSPLIICGGTGLYMRALRRGLFEGPSRNPQLRARLEKLTAAELFAELEKADPLTAARIDRHNPRRLVRALEVLYETGKGMAELQKQWKTPHLNPLPQTTAERRLPSPRLRGEGQGEGFCFCLNREREDLHARIERRIDAQIAAGWVEEVNRLLARGLEKNPTAMQAAGYRELVAHVRGELSLDEAVALIKTRTRQLAKRQLTWFRREPDLQWITVERDESPQTTAHRIRQSVA
ncbi:MAG TPA: tRNA (adenosine(37)-N6)-dimethylallyltransferase MiaA [Verrucomicrobiae bacterium]|nr:tRNA (adenosine(37)-N6)-dimethylallyltransferase MiaA [Verrucomicrobiae bacterium]